jgi:hypothetical protein
LLILVFLERFFLRAFVGIILATLVKKYVLCLMICVLICFDSPQPQLIVMAYPGRPFLFEKDSDPKLRKKFVTIRENEMPKQGDVITITIKEPLVINC